MTHSPPSSAAELAVLSREQAGAAFDQHDAPRDWLNDKARLAIMSPPGFIVSASPAMLALFGARDCEALEARLVRGEGPSARRLRHLAATLPVGEPPRLEPIRVVVDRRPAGVNLRCVRIEAPGGLTWLLASVPALGAAIDEPPAPTGDREAPQPEAPAPPDLGGTATPNSRFLWTLDEEGRFGAVHPVLVAAVGASAPRRGESVEALLHRAGLGGGDELARALGERRTFSGVTVEWPLSGAGRRRLVALSAAPMFGRHREFLGYRGFGVLGEEIEAAAPETSVEADGAKSAPALTAASEPGRAAPAGDLEAEVDPRESAADPVEPNLEFAPTDGPDAALPEASLEAGGVKSAPALPEGSEPEPAAPADDLEAEVEREGAAEPIEPNLELSPTDAPEAAPPPEEPESD
ncbi:MAG: hypothetical protein ACREDI_12570, partial [Roseiarcus sp.]